VATETRRPVEATEEEVERWVAQKRELAASGEKVFTVEDVRAYQLDDDEAWELITAGNGCALCWANEDGSPGGSFVRHAVLDGAAYLLLLDGDEAIPALRHDPRVSVVFDGGDGIGAVTVRGTVDFVDDPAALVSVVLATGRHDGLPEDRVAEHVRQSRPGRDRVVRLNRERWVTFSHKKIFRG